jgi:hypothetical protein
MFAEGGVSCAEAKTTANQGCMSSGDCAQLRCVGLHGVGGHRVSASDVERQTGLSSNGCFQTDSDRRSAPGAKWFIPGYGDAEGILAAAGTVRQYSGFEVRNGERRYRQSEDQANDRFFER